MIITVLLKYNIYIKIFFLTREILDTSIIKESLIILCFSKNFKISIIILYNIVYIF